MESKLECSDLRKPSISRLSEVMLANTESSNYNISGHGPSRTHREEFDGSRTDKKKRV